MQIKKILCLLLCLTMLAGIMTGCGNEGPVSTQEKAAADSSDAPPMATLTTDSEIQKAVELGFVPDTLTDELDTQISYAEFCTILDNFISLIFPDALSVWKQASADYREAAEPMSRMEGALVLLYAAECCGIDAVGYEHNVPLEDFISADVDFYEGVTWDYPLLPDIRQPYHNETLAASEHYAWRCGEDYADNAKRFVEYMSYGNGKTYFDYDERYSLNLGSPFTRADAIRAVERLYENARFALYVSAGDVSCTVSEAAIQQGTDMPTASWQQLPDWHGYTVAPGSWTAGYGAGMRYEKEHIQLLAELGFNFVRAPLDSRLIFKDTDMNSINPAYLETMDNLIEYCAEYGIHICFDLHDMPGFYTGGDDSQITLWSSEETQELFTAFWSFLAEYYREIPGNLLSFNLLNEPHDADGQLTDEIYSEVMLKAIDAIRNITPERLIFVDMLGVVQGTPVQGLKDAQVVQTVHPYFLRDGTQTWPIYSISGFIHRNNGVLTLTGDFPVGTKIEANIAAVHADSMFSLSADGESLASIRLGTETVGENGCTHIGEEGTDGEFRDYEGIPLTGELAGDCSQITLTQDGGWWYQLNALTISTENYTVTISTDSNTITDEEVPVLSFDENGVVSARKDSTIVSKSREWLDDVFRSYEEFSDETGAQIMVQEFGFNETLDYQVTLAAANDFLTVLDDYDIPWCSWCGSFGPILDNRDYEWNALMRDTKIKRNGANYSVEAENWLVDTALMEVYHRYMK